MNDGPMTGWRLIVRVLLLAVVFCALLFVPAGRLDWYEGWAFVVFYIAAVMAIYAWMMRRDPELARERQSRPEDQPTWDKVITRSYSILALVEFVLAALDSGRFFWSDVPVWGRVLGWGLLALSLSLIWWVLATNTFASHAVRLQEDRQQRVIDSGPYAIVRHPMYVGVIICFLAVPLVLRSLWALIVGGVIVALFILRTALEDRALQQGLPGYVDYVQRVRWRLIPGLW